MGLQVGAEGAGGGVPGRGALQVAAGGRVGGGRVPVPVVAEGARRALRFPHRRRLRGVAGHGVAGAGAVLRGHLPVLHDLLDLGPFVLEPDFHQRGHGTRPAASGSPRAAQAATGGTSPGAAPRGSAAGPQPRESRVAEARERPGGTSPRPASSLPPSLPPPPAAGRPLGERRCSCLQLGGKLPRAALYK